MHTCYIEEAILTFGRKIKMHQKTTKTAALQLH